MAILPCLSLPCSCKQSFIHALEVRSINPWFPMTDAGGSVALSVTGVAPRIKRFLPMSYVSDGLHPHYSVIFCQSKFWRIANCLSMNVR